MNQYRFLKDKRILIIDSDYQNKVVLRSFIEDEGCLVMDAISLTEAVGRGDREGYDLLIISQEHFELMHYMGLAPEILVAGKVQGKNVPVILSGDMNVIPFGKASEKMGGYPILYQPYRKSVLLELIGAALSTESEVQMVQETVLGIYQEHCCKQSYDLRLLVAEDNYVNQQYFTKLLSNRVRNLLIVGDGKAAVDAYFKNPFDLIIMDCQMPIMDGYEAASKIREMETEARHSTIVALSGNATKNDVERCKKAGMDDYLVKPVNLKEIERLLKHVAYDFSEL